MADAAAAAAASGGIGPSTSSGSNSSTGLFSIAAHMPLPGSSNAPKFKGKDVKDFLDLLESYANQSGLHYTSLPQYVERYCTSKVKRVLEGNTLWAGTDWAGCRTHLTTVMDIVPYQVATTSYDTSPKVSIHKC
ncbi:hypothetical protein FPV67DRAFT_1448240 [Lyophyllum atratum]|nr:hypothetical protein FPV67DRAFT_1448240 [Lyophyllum atratum]